MSDIGKAILEITAAQPGYEAAREYDDINLYEQFMNSRAGRTLRQADIEFDPNFCGVVINAVSNRMTINSITSQDDATTEIVNEIWHSNELDLFWPDWQRNALRDGDGYLMAWPKTFYLDEEGIEQPIPVEAGITYLPEQINITHVDPTCGRLFYDEEDPRVKKYFSQLWAEPVPGEKTVTWRLNMIYRDRIEKYATIPKTNQHQLKVEDFKPWTEELGILPDDGYSEDEDVPAGPLWPELNPFLEVPVWHLRTALQYGKPEHANAFALQDGISKLLQALMTTVEFQGWPQMYAIQEANDLATQTIREDPLNDAYAGDLDDDGLVDGGAVNLSQLPNGTLTNETGSDIEMSPGAMMVLKAFKAVGQFTAADPNVFLEPWREFALAIGTTTDTPSWMFPSLGGTIPSGESLKMVNFPLNKKTSRRCLLFAAALRGALAFTAKLCGAADAVVNIEWEPVETVSETERWTLVKLRQDAGVPFKDAMMMAGIPESKADEWVSAKEAQQAADQDHALALASATKVPATAPNGKALPVKAAPVKA